MLITISWTAKTVKVTDPESSLCTTLRPSSAIQEE